jgi:tRNA-splicing ligase RtcB
MKTRKVCISVGELYYSTTEEAKRVITQYHKTMEQFQIAMQQPFVVAGALMPDAHPGYALPIGGVVATDGVVVPAWVGYDIGCGVSATSFRLSVDGNGDMGKLLAAREEIKEAIKRRIPVGFKHRKEPVKWSDYDKLAKTEVIRKQFEDGDGFYQLGTLGGGNHFIEVGIDEEDTLWIVVHSGSRNIGHKTAQHYMRLAANSKKAKEGHYGMPIASAEGVAYLKDQAFCREFALANRKHITLGVYAAIGEVLGGIGALDYGEMINRNHNHVVLIKEKGWCLHRKGATQAEKGKLGIIPGNMRDGSYIVEGLGNEKFLWSSSHGAGRAYGRKEAKEKLSMDDFKDAMKGIVADVKESILDESPGAYKNFSKVMEAQKESVRIIHHIKPLINVKG